MNALPVIVIIIPIIMGIVSTCLTVKKFSNSGDKASELRIISIVWLCTFGSIWLLMKMI